MLWTIAVVLIILGVLGFVTRYTMGGFIQILLVDGLYHHTYPDHFGPENSVAKNAPMRSDQEGIGRTKLQIKLKIGKPAELLKSAKIGSKLC